MRAVITSVCMLAAGLWALPAWADIYIWEDADGVKHISNLNPPPGAEVFLRTPANPPTASVEEGDAPRQEEVKQADILGRENRRREEEAALERRLAETEAKVEEARAELERARNRLEDVQARYARDREEDRRYAGSLIYRPVYGRWPHHRYKHPRFDRPSWPINGRRYGITIQAHPFHLGAVHIPLYNALDGYRRPYSHGRGAAAFKHRGHANPRGERHRHDDRRR